LPTGTSRAAGFPRLNIRSSRPRRRQLDAGSGGVNAAFLERRKKAVHPTREFDIPGNRRLREARIASLKPAGKSPRPGALKDFTAASEHKRRSGQYAYDFSWMWAELGIEPKDSMNLRTPRARKKPVVRSGARTRQK